jgi:hypothetical protein
VLSDRNHYHDWWWGQSRYFNLFVIDSGGISPSNTGDDYTYQSP